MKYHVVVASPYWALNGPNTFSANLVRGLRARGVSAEILLTEQDTELVDTRDAVDPLMPLPADGLPAKRLPVGRTEGWGAHWRAMICYLEERAPCIYVPNFDWRHAVVSSRLSAGVATVGVLHSDSALEYEFALRLARYWNAIVAVSREIAEHASGLDATWAPRLRTIHCGVKVPDLLPEHRPHRLARLRVTYAGRIEQEQKRVLDLPEIISALTERDIPVELTVVGGGDRTDQLLERSAPLIAGGGMRYLGTVSNERVLTLFEESDVFILTSRFEGLPISLLEAMGRGCVPVVSDVRSGIPELICDGVNGFRVPVGDIEGFADRLALLQQDPARRREMSSNAYRTIAEGGYRLQDMIDRYLALFERVLWEAERGIYRRPRGRLLAPPESVAGEQILPGNYEREIYETELSLSWRRRLPARANRALDRAARKLRRVGSDEGLR